jgi:hypothetical protein
MEQRSNKDTNIQIQNGETRIARISVNFGGRGASDLERGLSSIRCASPRLDPRTSYALFAGGALRVGTTRGPFQKRGSGKDNVKMRPGEGWAPIRTSDFGLLSDFAASDFGFKHSVKKF